MKKRIFAVLLAFALLLSHVPALPAAAAEDSQTASGTTYYVSSLNGAEGNNGTSESTPFASLLEINDITLQPGDRVLLERGSVFVDEYLHVKGSGSEDAPIIIDVYGDENQPKPLIQTNGNGVWYQDYGKSLDNSNHVRQGNVSSCILLYDVEYIEISNIAMTNEGNFADGEVYNSAYRMDRTGVAGVAQNIGTVDHIVLKNLDIRNVQGNVYNKHMCNGGIYFVCHQPEDDTTGVARYDDLLIEGCTLDEVNRWGIAVGYTAYWDKIPYGSTIDDTVCQTYGSTNVVIRGNYLTNIGGDGITTMYCYRPLMEYNVLSGYCQDITDEIYVYEYNRGGQVAAGIWPWMCKTAIMQYNECYDSTYNQDGQAWDADWGDNAIYQYNYSSNNAGGAVMFCGQYACNTVFRYNISQNDLSGVLNLASSPNGEIYNNVFYMKEGVKINRTGMSGGWGNTISNNIFYYSGETPADSALGNWGDITATWSNNVYYNFANIPADDYAITADPLLVNPGSAPTAAQTSGLVHDRSVFDGYKLREDSPAIDAGVSISDNGGLDFFGNELDLIPDVGVYDAGTCDADADTAVRVVIPLDGTVTLSDLTGDYTASELSGLDSTIASLALERLESITVDRVSEAVTELEAGASYIICNVNTGSAITTTYESAPAWDTNALRLGGGNTVADNNVWTLEASGSGYKIKSAAGTYINISLNASVLDSVGDVFTPTYSNGTWTLLAADGNYLDNLGRLDYLGGWTEVGNSSTWNIYKVTTQTIDGGTELTFTGNYPGTTSVVVGRTLYQIEVTGNVVEVSLDLGETATFTDPTGNYVGADTSTLDPLIATVTLTGVSTEDSKSLSDAVTALESGKDYLILNNRANKPVTNQPASAAAAAGAGSGLSLQGTKEDVEDAAIWTITGSNGTYTVQDSAGQYMTVGANSAGLTSSAAQLSLAYNGSGWTIAQDGAYLNHFGGDSSTCAAGWQDTSAAADAGSQWTIYQVIYTPVENGTQIVFTATGGGKTYLRIGSTIYEITVNAEPHSHVFNQQVMTEEYLAARATCAAAERYYYSCACGEKGTETFESGDPLAHSYVNGFCEAVEGESHYEPAVLNADGVYEISNGGQLYWFASLVNGGINNTNASAVLTADIVVNEKVLENGELVSDTGALRAWTPIGITYDFSGTLDGQGHTISGLYVNSADEFRIGLVSWLDEGGKVCGLTLADTYFRGYNFCGGIVGKNDGTVENCAFSGVLTGESYCGGIVGDNRGDVTNCYNLGAISGDSFLGGIVGDNEVRADDLTNEIEYLGSVTNCYSVGTVSGNNFLGGIVGSNTVAENLETHEIIASAIISNCYFSSDNFSGDAVGSDDSRTDTAYCSKTNAQFASGEVCWLLNGSASDGELVWYQNLDNGQIADASPKFIGGTVYVGYASCDGQGYTNNSAASETKPDHTPDENGLCTVCGYQYVARIGDTLYTDFSRAWSDAKAASNAEVPLELLTDVQSGLLYLLEGETVKLTGGSITGTSNAVFENNGTLIIENCDITAQGYFGVYNAVNGTAALTGCTITAANESGTAVDNDGIITISDCQIISENIAVNNSGAMTITGSTTIDGKSTDLISRGGTIDLTNAAIPQEGWTLSGYASVVTVSTDLALPQDYYVFLDGKVVEALPEGESGTILLHAQHTGSVTYADNGDGTHTGTYDCCGLAYVANEAHTPSESGLCTVCGYQYAACVTTAEDEVTYCMDYREVQNELGALPEDGSCTVTMFLDMDNTNSIGTLNVPSGTVTFDLNGCTLGSGVILNGGTLTILDTAEEKGTIVNYSGVAIFYYSGQLIIDASVDCLGEAEGRDAWCFKQGGSEESATIGTTGTEDVVIPEGCVLLGLGDRQEMTVLDRQAYIHRHADSATDTDHTCDTCPKILSQCADGNTDHKCDECGAEMGEHKAAEGKHTCDYCGEVAADCADNDKDHLCDVCQKELTKCADEDKDHLCDICQKELTKCADKNNDHKCDVCEEVLTECVDKNNDGKCDVCGKLLGVIRLAGAHRWATSLMVADEMKANLGVEKFGSIIIASGNDFADALAGSYLSTVKNAPILLSWGKGGNFEYLDTDNIEYIKANLAEGGTVYILGGTNAVPELYEEALKGYNVKRLGGADRFETNLLILAEAGVEEGSEILVCTSTNFADSLSASATGKPILLVFNELGKLYGAQPEYLAKLQNCTFTVIGGESAVSADLAKAIETYGKVERLAGANRFETSVLVAEKYFEEPTTAVLAYAWNYPDGLCGGSLAFSMDAPLVLTMTKYEAQAVEYATENSITSGIVLGGDGLISDDAVRAVFAMDADDEIIVK